MDLPLIAPPSPIPYPAPYWLLVALKTLGFTLHMLPMHLWFAGLAIALWARRARGRDAEHAARLSDRTVLMLPVVIGYGINFGIIPLLFLQVAYYRAFYPATILMAWPWLSVIALLTAAYYGVYIRALALRAGGLPRWRGAAGWAAAGLFIVIGWLFTNAFSLMTNVGAWRGIRSATEHHGAVLGLGLNVADPTLWPRWLMMLGLAITSSAVWFLADAAVFSRAESPAYRRWAARFAVVVHTAGLLWFAAAGSWYIFGTLPADARARLFSGAGAILTVLTALGPGAVWILLLLAARSTRQMAGGDDRPARGLGIAVFAAQFLMLALQAISRQRVQNWELLPWLDVAAEPVRTQSGPMAIFLISLVGAIGLSIWMIRATLRGHREMAG